MPFVNQITFDIETSNLDQIQVGRSLQLSIAYLKSFLADEPGFINARAMYSLEPDDLVKVAFESTWEDWEYLDLHRSRSPFAEEKMLTRFEMKVAPLHLVNHIYEEIA